MTFALLLTRLRQIALPLCLLLAAQPALAAPPAGQRLIPTELKALRYFGSGDAVATVQEVAVTGQPFSRALRIDTTTRTEPRKDFGLQARVNTPVKKGDVLWISFKARRLQSSRESGEAFFELRFDQLVDGKYRWPAHLDRGISVGEAWTETSIPFQMEKDGGPEDTRLVIQFDTYANRFELGPITFVNHGSAVALTDLPRSTVRYEGGEPDAPWRTAAAERIERIRKGELALRVVDASGQPLAGASVAVTMKRIAFDFGTAVQSSTLLNNNSADAQRYRDTVERHFNQVVFENEMKWNRWSAPGHSPAPTLKALDWLDQRGITARGHVMVWPSWRHLPPSVAALKDDKAALRKAVFDHIAHQTRVMQGRFTQWDVTNELSLHHDLLDLLGWDELAAWYRAARAGEPKAKLFYNEYTMFHADPAWEHFYNTVKSLKDKGAQLDGIGEQAHIGGTPPGISLVLARLDRFAALGYPITITEFDINGNDQDFQARYLRDFLTAVFSHPGVSGFVQWGFWEGQHWFPAAALWNKDWTLREQGKAYIELVGKTWRSDFQAQAASDGIARSRAFYGDYDVNVTHAGKVKTVRIKHQSGQAAHVISLP